MAKRLRELDLNATIKFGKHQVNMEEPWDIIWRIAAKEHECEPAYPANSVTLLTDKTIDRRAVDATEPNNPDSLRKIIGNNNFGKSNLLQWLNSDSEAGKWYTPQHEYDAPPDTSESVSKRNTHYAHRPGFQKFFTSKEKESILETTIRVVRNVSIDGGGYEDLRTKVFIPSKTEVGFGNEKGIAEGACWSIFTDGGSVATSSAPQAYENTLSSSKTQSADHDDVYFLRTANTVNGVNVSTVEYTGEGTTQVKNGEYSIRPALNLSGDLLVSDETDADGCYTVIYDKPPEIITIPEGELGVQSKALNISYTVTDPDEDLLTVTEYLNGAVIRTMPDQPSGTRLNFTPQWQTLELDTPYTAEIEVTDGILTTARTWTFKRSNASPFITATLSGNLGKLAVPLNQAYTISDPNSDTMTVTETLDGQIIRSLSNQPSGSILTLDLTDHWEALSKDSPHSAAVEITDGLETAVYRWTFSVIEPIRQGITVSPSPVKPTGVVIPVLPVEVLVSNNAGDAEPVWEDASKEYLERKQYSFKNDTKTANEWCVGIKYNVNGVSIPVNLTTVHKFDLS